MRRFSLFGVKLLLLLCCFPQCSLAGWKHDVKDNLNERIHKLQKDTGRRNHNFGDGMENYKKERTFTIHEKQRDADRLLQRLQGLVNSASNSCKNHKNKHSCINQKKVQYQKQIHDDLEKAASDLQSKTVFIADRYLAYVNDMLYWVWKNQQAYLSIESEMRTYIHGGQFKQHDLQYAFNWVSHERKYAREVIKTMDDFKKRLQEVVYGTMCFDVIGATGRINTAKERQEFNELTVSAMEVACSQEGVDADVVIMKIVRQQFVNRRRQRHLRLATSGSSGDNGAQEEDRELQRSPILRIGALIGIICNCKTEDLVNDIWRRRMYQDGDDETVPFNATQFVDVFEEPLKQEQGLEAEAAEDEEPPTLANFEWEDDGDDDDDASLDSAETTASDPLQDLLREAEADDDDLLSSFPLLQGDDDDDDTQPLQLFAGDDGSEETEQPTDTEQPIKTEAGDAFDAIARQLFSSRLQSRYVDALNSAFRQSALSRTLQVTQIPCRGFISDDPYVYIKNFT